MSAIGHSVKPIAQTAFWTGGIRMEDAQANNPICGDQYAALFTNNETTPILERFKAHTKPRTSVLVRHRMIDEILRKNLAQNASSRIILLGAGFDSRAYRLSGGDWVEFDEPEIIQYKNERLPTSSCPNPLVRVATDFSTSSLKESLVVCQQSSPPIIVIEGVFMYLEQNQIVRMLQTLREVFPKHCLICDLMSRSFVNRFAHAFNKTVLEIGAPIKFLADSPESLFQKMGYRVVQKASVIETARDYGVAVASRVIRVLFRRSLIGGNSVCVFS